MDGKSDKIFIKGELMETLMSILIVVGMITNVVLLIAAFQLLVQKSEKNQKVAGIMTIYSVVVSECALFYLFSSLR